MRIFSIVIMVFCLVSCASQQSMPIAYECPKIILPDDPPMPIQTLTPGSKPDAVMKAWVATTIGYRDWNRIVRQQISST